MLWVVIGGPRSGKTTLLKKMLTPNSMMAFDCNTKEEVDRAIKYIENETSPMDFVIAVPREEMVPYKFYRSHWIITLERGLPEPPMKLQIVCDTH